MNLAQYVLFNNAAFKLLQVQPYHFYQREMDNIAKCPARRPVSEA